ncbi:MAG: hypothetical protein HYY00_06870 [Chloroflexi bacterium]|nr:hypothetical protein [Chloroflexota bacterium]
MKVTPVRLLVATLLAMGLLLVLAVTAAFADHSWNGYHWARTSNPFTLKLVDSVTSAWNSYLGGASADWTASSMLDTAIVSGSDSSGTRKSCRAVLGYVRVCNSTYGNNGWLGIAQVWVSGDHIGQGVVKLNDTYFNTATYNKPAWRQYVTCQEIGHTLGLDHQDENFSNANLGSCMDYTNDPDGSRYGQLDNTHPNQHDYDQLATIYAHTDGYTSASASSTKPGAAPAPNGHPSDEDFGAPAGKKDQKGRDILFVKNLGGGAKAFTWVFWAD